MLGKVLSVVTGSANNPWKPTTQEEYNAMVADKDKIGNYVEYAGKTYRIEAAHFEGAFKVGETYRTVYFDTTKTPYSYVGASDETTVFVEWINKTLGIKYLMVDDNRCSEDFFTIKLKRGLVYAYYTDGTGRAIIDVDKNGYSAVYDDGLIAYSNKWHTENMGEGGSVSFEEDFTPTTVLSSLYTWNSYIAYPKFVPQYARRYYPLSALSTPASASDIKKGKQAYDETGSRITGTHEEPQNPWAPATEAEYKKLLVPSNVGNFFDYDNKITRLKTLSVSDSLALGDSITGLYFDTTKTPTVPDFSSGYEGGNEMRLKYLFKTSTMSEGPVPYCGLFWYYADDAGKTFIALVYADSNDSIKYVYGAPEADSGMTWLLSMNEGGDPTGFTLSTAETITSLNSDTNWNGVYVFKNKVVDVAEYAEVGGGENRLTQYFTKTLTEVTEEDLVGATMINAREFQSFEELTQVAIPNSVTYIDSSAFYYCKKLKDVTFANGVTQIEYEAFKDCNALTSVELPNSLTTLGTGAFNGCTGLKNVIISNNILYIADYVFNKCSGLTNVVIPDSASYIGKYSFSGCSGLTDVIIGNGVKSIGDYAFNVCTILTNITIPDSVTSIGKYSFQSCRGLINIDIPNNVADIGEAAFYGCVGLTRATIGNNIKSIGQYAFYNCEKLESIAIFSITPPSLGKNVFLSANALTTIIVPKGSGNAYKAASGWSNYADKIVEAAN